MTAELSKESLDKMQESLTPNMKYPVDPPLEHTVVVIRSDGKILYSQVIVEEIDIKRIIKTVNGSIY